MNRFSLKDILMNDYGVTDLFTVKGFERWVVSELGYEAVMCDNFVDVEIKTTRKDKESFLRDLRYEGEKKRPVKQIAEILGMFSKIDRYDVEVMLSQKLISALDRIEALTTEINWLKDEIFELEHVNELRLERNEKLEKILSDNEGELLFIKRNREFIQEAMAINIRESGHPCLDIKVNDLVLLKKVFLVKTHGNEGFSGWYHACKSLLGTASVKTVFDEIGVIYTERKNNVRGGRPIITIHESLESVVEKFNRTVSNKFMK